MFTTMLNSFNAGELSPSVFGRTDLKKYADGASTMRNFFANYRGGASSRAGTLYIGMCKQGAPNVGGTPTNNPPRDIPFQFNVTQGYALEFGDQYMRIKSNGAYVTESPITVSSVNSSGLFTTLSSHGYSVGDWIYNVGNTGFNGLVWIVTAAPTGTTFTVSDLFGNSITSATASTSGTMSRIYTVVSPYAAIDLPYLKYTESADTMSLTCVNQATGTSYPPYDLERFGATNWTFSAVTFATSISAPTGLTATARNSTTLSTYYSYQVTAVAADGEESVASSPVSVQNNDIAIYAGSNSLSWTAVTGASGYNIYAATPLYGAAVPSGVLYGFLGTSTGTNFTDTNIVPDFTVVPPQATNPFSSGGNYPAVVAYYQQRRVYGSTQNNPDTYYMSQPGAFKNMDVSIPVTDADAIVGAPWAQQINGIQFMVPMPGGLIIFTGNGAWQVNGGSNAAITPADQDATPQAYGGCSTFAQPIPINYSILFVEAKQSLVYELEYNYFAQIYLRTDKTVLSNHLFSNHSIQQWAYTEQPYKIVWAIREDGILLSLTFLKEQDVCGWARHDTNGFFQSVCAVTGPHIADIDANQHGTTGTGPLTDALYVIVKRFINGVWVYYSERMDDRNWFDSEDSWCVDCGLSYPATYPNATLSASSATGSSNISSTNVIFGGSGYTAPTATAIDSTGSGSGATFHVNVSGGVITSVVPLTQGINYTQGYTQIVISDSTGSGAVVNPVITNYVTLTASNSVFNSGMVGNVIRTSGFGSGSGKATIVSFTSGTQVIANITQPITPTIPNDPNSAPVPSTAGNWSLSVPVSSVSGLNHLNGMTVAIVADGSVQPSQVVTNGSITLPAAYSQILIGLPYTCQLQSMYLNPPGHQDTPQGKRKSIFGVTVRMEGSRGMSVGTNQLDASTLPNVINVPWSGLYPFKERNALIQAGSAIPLFTGDEYIQTGGDWNELSQVAIQQTNPMPANVNGMIVWYSEADTSG